MTATTIVRRRIETVVNRVLTESGRPSRIFEDDDSLTQTIGLTSLDLAQVVVSLEQEFGVDPFRVSVPRITTLGDLVALYQDAVGGSHS